MRQRAKKNSATASRTRPRPARADTAAGARRRRHPASSAPTPPAHPSGCRRCSRSSAWLRAAKPRLDPCRPPEHQRASRQCSACASRAQDQLRLDGRLIRQRAPTDGAGVAVSSLARRAAAARRVRQGARTALARARARARCTVSMAERLPRRAGRRFISISPMPTVDGGLELLTADGALAARLQRAVRGLEMEFSVRVRGELNGSSSRRSARACSIAAPRCACWCSSPGAVRAAIAGIGWSRVGASGNEMRATDRAPGRDAGARAAHALGQARAAAHARAATGVRQPPRNCGAAGSRSERWGIEPRSSVPQRAAWQSKLCPVTPRLAALSSHR